MDNVAVPDEGDFFFQKTVAGIEGRLENNSNLYNENDDDNDNLVPSAAAEMGAGEYFAL